MPGSITVTHSKLASASSLFALWARRLAALLLVSIAVGGNVLIATVVVNGFGGPSVANGSFGRPNLQIPISDAAPIFIPQNGPRFGFTNAFPPVQINILLLGIDPDNLEASVAADLSFPRRLLLQIPGREGSSAVESRNFTLHLTKFGKGLSLPLRIGPGYVGAAPVQLHIPLTKAVRSVNAAQPLTLRFELPLQGRPSAFPDDWYETASSVVLFPPTSWVLTSRRGEPSVPVHLKLAAGPGMRGYSVAMVSKPTVDGDFLRLVAQTNSQTKTLSYLIGVVPILLALIAFILLLSSLFGEYSTNRIQELAFTVVLGILAVLPIREVTIPAGLHGLTRIDLLLSLGVTLSVGVLLLALAVQLGLAKRSDGPAAPTPAGVP